MAVAVVVRLGPVRVDAGQDERRRGLGVVVRVAVIVIVRVGVGVVMRVTPAHGAQAAPRHRGADAHHGERGDRG